MWRSGLKWGVDQPLVMYPCVPFSFIFSHFGQFSDKNGCFWGWHWSQDCSIFQIAVESRYVPTNLWRGPIPKIWVFLHFQLFSAISASFQLKWLFLQLILKLRLLNISNYSRNATILLKMRGQPISGDVTLPTYPIFLPFQPFSAILGCF